MPTKTDPRDKTGAIIHAIANRVLSDHNANKIYAKFIAGGPVFCTTDLALGVDWNGAPPPPRSTA